MSAPAPQLPGWQMVSDSIWNNDRRVCQYQTAPNLANAPAFVAPAGWEVLTAPVHSPASVRWMGQLRQLESSTPTPIPTPTPTHPPAVKPPGRCLGVNLPENGYWIPEFRYNDLVKSIAGWDTSGNRGNHQAPVGADGWPTSDFSVVLIDNATPAMLGDYSVIFEGHADVSVIGGGASVVHKQPFDGKYTRATVHYDPRVVPSLSLTFTNTSGPRRLKVLRPNVTEAADASDPIHPYFYAFFRALGARVVRFMDAVQTNTPGQSGRFNDRTKPESPTFNPTANHKAPGMCWEWVIHIANQLNAHPWINVPVTCDTDYWHNLAALFRDNLNPNLGVIVAWGNEVWNAALGSYPKALDQAKALRATNRYDPSNDGAALWEHMAFQAAELGKVFKAAMPGRAWPVLEGQAANPAVLTAGLAYLKAREGNPSAVLWGVAVAPYSPLTPDLDPAGWQVQELSGPHVQGFLQQAAPYGLVTCCYECGCDNPAKPGAAQLDPRMQDLVRRYLSAWGGTGPINWYASVRESSSIYALSTDGSRTDQPKFLGAKQFAEST